MRSIGQEATARRDIEIQTGLVALTFAAATLMMDVGPVAAEEAARQSKPSSTTASEPAKRLTPPPPIAQGSLAEQYCKSVSDAGREARHAVQLKQIEALRKELDERLAKIDTAVAEFKEWFRKREEFANRATTQLVGIYAAMRPESASEQLAKMDEATAAAIIGQLDARKASAILNDMPAEKAANLATILSAASRKSEEGGKS